MALESGAKDARNSNASRISSPVSEAIKLSSRATRDFWEIPIVYEDDHLLALNKPACLLTSPDRYDPNRPNLMKLLHRDLERGADWAKRRQLSYLMNAHRLDFETTGIILLAKSKPILVSLANLFGSEKPAKIYVALVVGNPKEEQFEIDAKLAPHLTRPGLMRVDHKNGKKSKTIFTVRERFKGYTLLKCRPVTGRTHQIRVHASYARFRIVGDNLYAGPQLLLSQLKPDYRLKGDKTERPLLSSAALHAEQLRLPHPVTGHEINISAPWPKDLTVALKYLRRYAGT